MENSIVQVFNCDQFQNLRVVRRGEDLWFFARYVCNALDLNITGNALAALDDDEKSELTRAEGNIVLNNVGSTGGSELLYDFSAGGRAPMLVSESGLYKLIMRSRKPSAKAFQNWLAREVLPALRRTGTYTIPGARTAVPRDYLSALEALVAAERGRVALSNQLKVIEQKLNEVTSKLGETVELILPSWFNNLTGNMRIDIKDAKGNVWILSHSTTGKTWVRKKKVF